jgi:hypothetical protein
MFGSTSIKLMKEMNIPEKWNVAAEWLRLFIRIQKATDSNPARRPATLTDVFHGFPQPLQINAEFVLKLRHNCFHPLGFKIIIH